jgi:hypothetical protein
MHRRSCRIARRATDGRLWRISDDQPRELAPCERRDQRTALRRFAATHVAMLAELAFHDWQGNTGSIGPGQCIGDLVCKDNFADIP